MEGWRQGWKTVRVWGRLQEETGGDRRRGGRRSPWEEEGETLGAAVAGDHYGSGRG